MAGGLVHPLEARLVTTGDNGTEAEALGPLREKIDDLDRRIVELLNQRAEIVVRIGKAKRLDGTPIYAPDREHAVLQRIAALNTGPLPKKTLQAIYRELMSGSFALEKPLRIAYLGPEGSFSHMAAQRKFGANVLISVGVIHDLNSKFGFLTNLNSPRC